MKPPRFVYHDPTTRDEALAQLMTYADEAKILAGGQSLVPLLNMRLAQPAHLVDINRVSDLASIRKEHDGLAIGAMTRHREIERSPLVHLHCPLLAEAMPFIGHPPIRSRGTVGGSLAHADPAAELPAVLLALGGHISAESQEGRRRIPAEAFFVSELQTALASTELLTEVWFPLAPPRSGASFVEVSRRHGDFALVGAATQLTLHEDGTIAAAHLALLGVAPTPVRIQAVEALLQDARPNATLFSEAAEQAMAALDPPADMHASAQYRREVAGVLVSRALHTALERAHQGGQL
ncbi:MAG TPA: xanthine dehydrogenase family protein subunit M [Ktedonosporobacter sp.]|nr:xanthine dehydrogenase family protein subunit M [Ktedonosporobacter sp.]